MADMRQWQTCDVWCCLEYLAAGVDVLLGGSDHPERSGASANSGCLLLYFVITTFILLLPANNVFLLFNCVTTTIYSLIPAHCVLLLFNFIILTFQSSTTCTSCFSFFYSVPAHCALRRAWPVLERAVLAQPGQVLTICVFVDNIDKYLYLLTTLSNICIYWQIFANIEERQKRCLTISALLQFPPPLVRWTPVQTSWRLLKMLNWSYWNGWNYWHCWNYRGKKRRQGLFDKVEQNRWKTCCSVFTTKRVQL